MTPRLLAMALWASSATWAYAQVTITDSSTTVNMTSAQCVSAGDKTTLILKNQDSTNTITYCFAPCVAQQGAAGNYDVGAGSGGWVFWPAGTPPRNAINCVASGNGTKLSVGIGIR